MIIDAGELKKLAEALQVVEFEHQHVVDAEPEIKKYLDRARQYAEMRFDHVSSPTPADGRLL